MNHLEDHELIADLHAGIAERTAHVHAPDRLADDARRRARRRTATRAVGAGVPVLAAAGVTTALLAGSGGPTARTTIAPAAPSANAPAAHAQETAYIVRRVRAHLAGADQSDVMELVSTGNGGNGTAADPGVTNTDWFYTDPDSGVAYSRQVGTSAGGSELYTYVTVATPMNDGVHTKVTLLDPVQQAYAVTSSIGPKESSANGSSPAQIDQALNSGTVTQDGTATVNGQSTIQLTVPMAQGSRMTLYVNAQTYQLVREDSSQAGGSPYTWNWLPATVANIAHAKPVQIPAGYAQAPFAAVNREAMQNPN